MELTNTPAYFDTATFTAVKNSQYRALSQFIIALLFPLLTLWPNKLECLSLASLNSLMFVSNARRQVLHSSVPRVVLLSVIMPCDIMLNVMFVTFCQLSFICLTIEAFEVPTLQLICPESQQLKDSFISAWLIILQFTFNLFILLLYLYKVSVLSLCHLVSLTFHQFAISST